MYPIKITASSPNCDITLENLLAWKDILLYAKVENKISLTGLSDSTFNIYLGSVLSALNYTGDYCEIYHRLEPVRDAIPTIQTNLGL